MALRQAWCGMARRQAQRDWQACEHVELWPPIAAAAVTVLVLPWSQLMLPPLKPKVKHKNKINNIKMMYQTAYYGPRVSPVQVGRPREGDGCEFRILAEWVLETLGCWLDQNVLLEAWVMWPICFWGDERESGVERKRWWEMRTSQTCGEG
ncbi:hypothetical protein BC827DRAFT_1155002 [Russula dissimulans]|nr:hypothetical protein BC827DRAFT_1155002 [Russula dissimulans]